MSDLVGPKGIRSREARHRAIYLAMMGIDGGLSQWDLVPHTDNGTEEEADAIADALVRVRDDLGKLLPSGWKPARRLR